MRYEFCAAHGQGGIASHTNQEGEAIGRVLLLFRESTIRREGNFVGITMVKHDSKVIYWRSKLCDIRIQTQRFLL